MIHTFNHSQSMRIIMVRKLIWITVLPLLILIFPYLAFSGNTGKIIGIVMDEKNKEPLPGVNVQLEGTTMGAATGIDGDYLIMNVPPGIYTIRATMIGYTEKRVSNVRVSIDLTTTINVDLSETVLDVGREITVVATRPMVIKDQTATTAVVGADEIRSLPITEISDAIELQAGMVKGAGGDLHIRGGRAGEISYWIDGIPITDVYDGGAVVQINKEMVQELQVVSGAFNAEYGQAMSGIVNIATKGGSNKFGGSFTTYFGDHLSNQKKTFMNIDHVNPLAVRNFEGSLNGAIIKDKLFYYLNARSIYQDGYLYGQRRFNPNAFGIPVERIEKQVLQQIAPEYLKESRAVDENLVNFLYLLGTNATIDSAILGPENYELRKYYANSRGDGEYIPMNWSEKIYGQGKLIYKPFPSMTFDYSLIYDDVDYQEWGLDGERNYKYNPDGAPKKFSTGLTQIFKITHLLSSRTFYNFGVSNFSKEFQRYTYEDAHDPRYIHPNMGLQQPYSYRVGGTDNRRFKRETNTLLAKFDITSQVTKTHQIKSGLEFRRHRVYFRDINLQPIQEQSSFSFLANSPYIQTRIMPDSTIHSSQYTYHPTEFSAYIQDKMEFKNMIVNFGVRFDYFEPDGVVLADESDPSIYNPIRPENRYRDWGSDGKPDTFDADGTEGNGLRDIGEPGVTLKERQAYWYKKASAKYEISPRIGVSFPITDRGVIYFSYGHFFQIPRFERLYQNPDFEIGLGTGNQGVIGNSDLEPEQTINGEIGLQQQLSDDISLDVTGYFRDIRNLASTRADEIVVYGGAARYSKFVNSDFGFVRGIILALTKRFSAGLSASLDYTLQIAKGTNSDPEAARNALAGGSQPEVQLTALDWDQRHTINGSVFYAAKGWGGGLVAQYGSGLPYTPRANKDISSLLTNNQIKPATFNVDLRAYREFKIGIGTITTFVRVFNLFDRLNEINVFNDTGRAGFTTDKAVALRSRPLELINTLDDWFNNPTHYSEPRRIEFGVTFDF